MMVERCVKVHEVRKETACRHLACKFIEVVVAVFRQVTNSAFLLPDLDRKDCGGAVSYSFISSVEDLADDAASFCRCIGSVVDGTEHNLVSSA